MTLIAVFPAKEGFVLCADSQETCPSYDAEGFVYELRKAVQKIEPADSGEYKLSIAGSGNPTLIEGFIIVRGGR